MWSWNLWEATAHVQDEQPIWLYRDFRGKRSRFYPLQRVCILVDLFLVAWKIVIPIWKGSWNNGIKSYSLPIVGNEKTLQHPCPPPFPFPHRYMNLVPPSLSTPPPTMIDLHHTLPPWRGRANLKKKWQKSAPQVIQICGDKPRHFIHRSHSLITTHQRSFEAESAYFSIWKHNTRCCSNHSPQPTSDIIDGGISPRESSIVLKTSGDHLKEQ